jgi:hypothetical protein
MQLGSHVLGMASVAKISRKAGYTWIHMDGFCFFSQKSVQIQSIRVIRVPFLIILRISPRQASLLLITADFLWITLLELCIKLVEACGKFGQRLMQIC